MEKIKIRVTKKAKRNGKIFQCHYDVITFNANEALWTGDTYEILGIDLFTGKLDCKGSEVYGNDIILFDEKEWGDNTTNIHKVSWDERNAEWSWGGGISSDMEWRTKIGNIYQTPQLVNEAT